LHSNAGSIFYGFTGCHEIDGCVIGALVGAAPLDEADGGLQEAYVALSERPWKVLNARVLPELKGDGC
jgi:hypothetical protein